MRKWRLLLIPALLVLINGCTRQEDKSTSIRNTEQEAESYGVQVQNTDMVLYEQEDSLKESITIRFVDLPCPQHASISSWAVYGNVVYYAVEFMDYLEDNEGTGEMAETEQYCSKIMSYGTDSGMTDIVYQADDAIEITDVCFNGTTLIWEEYPRQADMSWQIRALPADGDGNQAEVIIRDGDTEGEVWDVIPSLTGQAIYWYDTVDADNMAHPAVLYSYDLESRTISTEKDSLDLSSPYEQPSVINDWMCCYYMDSGKGDIYIENTVSGEKTTLSVPTGIIHPVSNGHLCVWGESYDAYQREKVWVYDFSTKQTDCISLEQIGTLFAYTVLDNYIILTTSDGLWCLEPESQTYVNLLDDEEYLYLYVSHETDGSASTQLTGPDDGTMRIAVILH